MTANLLQLIYISVYARNSTLKIISSKQFDINFNESKAVVNYIGTLIILAISLR